MGLNYRKSFKIGKNTRVNVSKTGGIGISTGTKGVRVSVNKKGVRTQVGSNGMYYRDQYNFKNNSNTSYEAELISTDNISHNLPKELKAKASTKQWVLVLDRKSTRLNSSHANISYAVFCLKKKKI